MLCAAVLCLTSHALFTSTLLPSEWMLAPLACVDAITARQHAVADLISPAHRDGSDAIRAGVRGVGGMDLTRLVASVQRCVGSGGVVA